MKDHKEREFGGEQCEKPLRRVHVRLQAQLHEVLVYVRQVVLCIDGINAVLLKVINKIIVKRFIVIQSDVLSANLGNFAIAQFHVSRKNIKNTF